MTTTTPSAALVPAEPLFTGPERLALARFLAGYSGLTREVYALDLRQFASWCQQRHLRLFQVRRADIECFGRDLEARGRARATVTRRLCTIAGFYRYAVEEELLDHSPAAHVRRPRIDYESHATGLDRNELGALLVAAGLGPPAEHGLISLLALNGLRVSEATGANIEALGMERGHRTLIVGPHTLRHAFITAALDAGVPLRDVQEAASHADPRMTMRYDRARASLDRHCHLHCRGVHRRSRPVADPGQYPARGATPGRRAAQGRGARRSHRSRRCSASPAVPGSAGSRRRSRCRSAAWAAPVVGFTGQLAPQPGNPRDGHDRRYKR